jgi:nucleotide-binding universal stress UspA family protein
MNTFEVDQPSLHVRVYHDARRPWRIVMKRILVAIDGSDAATRAIEFAASLANAFDASLHLVNAVHDLASSYPELGGFTQAERISLDEALSAISQTVLQRGEAVAKSHGVKRHTTESRVGDAAEVILDIARNQAIDLVSLASTPVIVVP